MKLNTQTNTTIELTKDELISAIGNYLKQHKGVALPAGNTTFYINDSFIYRGADPTFVVKVSQG